MPPRVPRPAAARGRALAEQRATVRAGTWRERTIVFPFTTIAGTASQAHNVTVTSMGGDLPAGSGEHAFVRLVALRCILAQGVDVLPFEIPILAAQLRLRLQLNAISDFIGGNAPFNDASFTDLCATQAAPWFWWDDPPRMRAGDVLRATVRNLLSGDGSALLPQVHIRVMNDRLWRDLYVQGQL